MKNIERPLFAFFKMMCSPGVKSSPQKKRVELQRCTECEDIDAINELFRELVQDYDTRNEHNLEYDLHELSKHAKSKSQFPWSNAILPLLFDIIMNVTEPATFRSGCRFLVCVWSLCDMSNLADLSTPAVTSRCVSFIQSAEDRIWWVSRLLGRIVSLSEEFRNQVLSQFPFECMCNLIRKEDVELWNSSILFVIRQCCSYPFDPSFIPPIITQLVATLNLEMELKALCYVLDTLAILSEAEIGRGMLLESPVGDFCNKFIQKLLDSRDKPTKSQMKACEKVLTLCHYMIDYLDIYWLTPKVLSQLITFGHVEIAEQAMDIIAQMLRKHPDENVPAFRNMAIIPRLCENVYRSSAGVKQRSFLLLSQFLEWANDIDISCILMKTMLRELFSLFVLGEQSLFPDLSNLIQQIWTMGLRTRNMEEITIEQVANEEVLSTLETVMECPNRNVAEWATVMHQEIMERMAELPQPPAPAATNEEAERAFEAMIDSGEFC